jgi:hypothetical protein
LLSPSLVLRAGSAVFGPTSAAVAEVTIAPWWRRRLAYAFSFPGVDVA